MTKSQNAINWLEALLSGEYKQGMEQLGDKKSGFCCWGLACHIVGIDYHPSTGWDNEVDELLGINKELYDHGIYSGQLKTPITFNNFKINNLASANDAGFPFEIIAKHLIVHAKEQFNLVVAKNIQSHFKHLL